MKRISEVIFTGVLLVLMSGCASKSSVSTPKAPKIDVHVSHGLGFVLDEYDSYVTYNQKDKTFYLAFSYTYKTFHFESGQVTEDGFGGFSILESGALRTLTTIDTWDRRLRHFVDYWNEFNVEFKEGKDLIDTDICRKGIVYFDLGSISGGLTTDVYLMRFQN